MYEGCSKPDSDYYVYSIQGFDPCFFYDFTQEYEFKYKLNCKPINDEGVVKPQGHVENLGYNYADVVEYPRLQPSDFTYAAINNQTNLKVVAEDSLLFTFDFRDWKYLSQIERFSETVKDADVIAGIKEGSIPIDFNKLTKRDQ